MYNEEAIMSHNGALPFTFKKYLKANEEFMKIQIFHHAKIIIFKKSSKRNPKSFKILLDLSAT
jgi:hypothetical protein